MKSSVADYRYKTYCVRVVTINDGSYYFHAGNADLVMGGNTYLGIGQVFSSYTHTTEFNASIVDYEAFLGVAGVSRGDIEKGVFDGARAYLFATTWNNPVEDEEPLFSSVFGNAQLTEGKYTFEEIALVDLLKQRVGRSVGALCPWELGDSRCTKDLSSLTINGSVTSVVNNYSFYDLDSSTIQDDDFFGYGTLTFTSGNNAKGQGFLIKSYVSGKFELFGETIDPIQVGDEFTAIAGCRGRHQEDCITKHNNGARFGGFSHIPTNQQANKVGSLQ